MRVICVAGARPNYMKVKPVIDALEERGVEVILAFRILGLHKAVTWHTSTSQEKAEVERVFGADARSYFVINLQTSLSVDGEGQYADQMLVTDPHYCSLTFFSRIVRKKNFATVIRAMPLVKGKIRLSIAGPIEDARYWVERLKLIDDIGNPGIIKYIGLIPADGTISFLSRFDLFAFPTLGENFGRIVFESLAAGATVIAADDAPWHQIETAGADWIRDRAIPEMVAELIESFLALNEDARRRTTAHDPARQEVFNDPKGVDTNQVMFHGLTSSRSS